MLIQERLHRMKPKTCTVCGSSFQPNSGIQKSCAPCRAAFRTREDVRRREEKRAERGIWAMGTPRTCVDCGEGFPYRGGTGLRCKPCQKTRTASRQRDYIKGHPKRSVYRKRQREKALYGGNREASLERDGRACVKCGSTDLLHTHHIDNRGAGWPVHLRNNALDNLITLCNRCHQTLHAATERVLCATYPDTVRAVLEAFLRGEDPHCVAAINSPSVKARG